MTPSSTTSDRIVLECHDVEVEYRMATVRSTTLKELVVAKIAGRASSTLTRALKGVSLSAKRGECVALIGHNGCGKSTFLKVMAGILKPVRGTVRTVGRIAPLIELGAGFDPELTGRENVLLSCSLMGLSRREILERMDSIRDFAELGAFFESPVKTYSSGMYMRLGFSCATAIDANLLLIDEILAVGDENFQKKCMTRMHDIRNSGVATILVSHDLNVVQNIADRALVIDHGLPKFEGRPGEAVAFYRDLMEHERLVKISDVERVEEMRRRKLAATDWRGSPDPGSARILNVKTLGSGEVDQPLKGGQPWRLEIEIEVTVPFEEPPTVGYAITSSIGIRLFGGNTKAFSGEDPSTSRRLAGIGRHKVIFDFDTLPLATGKYVVVAAIHDHRLERTVQILGDAMRFSVADEQDPWNFDSDIVPPRHRVSAIRLEPTAVT